MTHNQIAALCREFLKKAEIFDWDTIIREFSSDFRGREDVTKEVLVRIFQGRLMERVLRVSIEREE